MCYINPFSKNCLVKKFNITHKAKLIVNEKYIKEGNLLKFCAVKVLSSRDILTQTAIYSNYWL